jgi:hypothetical protein
LANADFSKNSIRSALKRGLARQTIAQAGEADLPHVFRQLAELSPNHKAQARVAQRLQSQHGVVRVAMSATGMVVILRNRRQMISQLEEAEIFAEETLFYTRVSVRISRNEPGFHISRASLTCHALERLVERSTVALDRPLLSAVDAEAATILRHAAKARLIEDGEDHYAPAAHSGVWAGRVDLSVLEPEWNLFYSDATTRIPVFSARTFLGPEQMRPTVWLRWKGDPNLSMG